jgi:parvulin-like peptidyl-prolyl isomerase
MAKKKKLESKAPVPLTRGQLSRAQREQQRIRTLYTAGIVLGVLVVLLLGFAAVSTFIIKPNTAVASVNGVNINRTTYDKLRRWNIYQQLQQAALQQQLSQQTGGSTTDTSSTDLTTYQQQLKNVSNESPLDQTTVQSLVDNEVLRQKSTSDYQINPTTDDLKAEALKDFIPSPTPPPSSETPTVEPSATATQATTPTPTVFSSVTPSPTQTQTPTITPTKGTPTSTPTTTATYPPVPGASATAQAVYTRYIGDISAGTAPNANDTTGICTFGCPNLSESDYLSLVIEPRYRQNAVQDKMATTIITDVEQIHAEQIVTDTQDGANKIRQMLVQGADFATVANQQSKDQIQNAAQGTPGNGGDLGWFPKDSDISNLDAQFVAGAWPLKAGELSQPVQSSFGWHIIKVLERNPHMPLTQDQISTKKTKLYTNWIDNAKRQSQISPASAQAPTPTAPPLVEPTLPPAPSATPGAGGATPGASSPATGTASSATGSISTTTTTTNTGSTGGPASSGSPPTPTQRLSAPLSGAPSTTSGTPTP